MEWGVASGIGEHTVLATSLAAIRSGGLRSYSPVCLGNDVLRSGLYVRTLVHDDVSRHLLPGALQYHAFARLLHMSSSLLQQTRYYLVNAASSNCVLIVGLPGTITIDAI